MKKNRNLSLGLLLAAAALILASCQPAQSSNTNTEESKDSVVITNPYASREGDDKLVRGTPIIDSIKWDAQAETLTISGNLPTPCEELRIASSQSGKELSLEVYSLSQPDMLCAQVLQPFEAVLKLEHFSRDTMMLLVNGKPLD